MAKVITQTTEKKAQIPGLPAYLTVGTPARVRSSRTKIGPEQLRKLFDLDRPLSDAVKASTLRAARV
jgi:hypothetical protein